MLRIRPIPVLSDNYAWLLEDNVTRSRAVVDPGEAAPIEAVLGEHGLDLILLTHHHADHIGGVEALRVRTGAEVAGAASETARLPHLDLALKDGDVVTFGAETLEVIATPGHADGHLAYYAPSVPALFTGDALFSLGCGRLLEGTAEELFHSVHRFDALPDETLICCGHEYTLSNACFARHLDPDNEELAARLLEVERLREEGKPSVPTTLGDERRLNPFLRAPDVATFARIRALKDRF